MIDVAPAASKNGSGSSEEIRVGILCDGLHLAAWQLDCIQDVQKLPFAKLSALVVNAAPPRPRAPLLTRLNQSVQSGLWLWRIYERAVLSRKSRAMQLVALPGDIAELPKLEVIPLKHGRFRQSFDESSLDALRTLQVDVLLRFGFGILTGEILSLPRYGVWSFHHGDPEHFRGAPPGFWEIERGASVTGVVLQRLTETLDGGVILRSGWFKTNAASYPKSLDRILFGASHFVARALVDLRINPTELLGRAPLTQPGPVYRYPRPMAVLRFLANSISAWIQDQHRSLFRHQQWTLGMVTQPLSELFREVSLSSRHISGVTWQPERTGHFLADPFVVPARGAVDDTVILAEDFDWKTGLGQIVAVRRPSANAPSPIPVIRSRGHLSYPYTFEHNSRIFCTPESADGSQVIMHRYNERERSWEEGNKIIENFAALDPTIFRHGGRWWLFCTNANVGPNEFLYAWHSEDLNSGWTPHAGNPLKVDVRSARPAGPPFFHDGDLIRPAQDCSSGYGKAISFNRIAKLTPLEFCEEFVGKLLPETGTYTAGLHTIGAMGDSTIVDGARTTFVAAEFRRALRRKFRRS